VHYCHWDCFAFAESAGEFGTEVSVEFTLPSRTQESDPPNQSKKVHDNCAQTEAEMAAFETSTLADMAAETAKEGPEWREGHYRYEFDLGTDAPELVKMSWVVKDRRNNWVTSATTGSEHECWVKAAQSVKPWNRTAIRAEFVELATSDRKDTIRLWYTLTNTTDADYRLESMIGITTAAQAGSDSLYAFNKGMISLETPLIVPAHRKIQALLTVALQTDKSAPNDASDITVTIYKKDVMTFRRSKYAKMQGFVLMDEGTRYEIDFPFARPDKWEDYVQK
jgi:hypothetical protein